MQESSHLVTSGSNPVLIFIRGIPGSGKTHLTKDLSKRLDNVTVLDPDAVNENDASFLHFSKNLNDAGLDRAIHVFRWLREQAIQHALNDSVIVWNQPFTDEGIFSRLVQYIVEQAKQKHGTRLRVLIVEVATPEAIAWQRVLSRKAEGGHGPDEEIFRQRVSAYVSYKDKFDVITVDGTADFTSSVEAINLKIQSLKNAKD
jgi:predicted ABC-type ATPase